MKFHGSITAKLYIYIVAMQNFQDTVETRKRSNEPLNNISRIKSNWFDFICEILNSN